MKKFGKKGMLLLLYGFLVLAGICSADTVYAANIVIDLTDLFAVNAGLEHKCMNYLVSEYDDRYHWNKCTECEEILEKETHSHIDNGWTYGSANNCHTSNIHIFTCKCGHSYFNTEGKKSHGKTMIVSDAMAYYCHTKCSDCLCLIGGHAATVNGIHMDCSNTGECDDCGTSYMITHCNSNSYGDIGNVECNTCGKELYRIIEDSVTYVSDGNLKRKLICELNSNISGTYKGNYNTISSEMTNSDAVITIEGKKFIAEYDIKFNVKESGILNFSFVVDTDKERILLNSSKIVNPENTPPVINGITEKNVNMINGWSTSKEITINGTENYCDSVSIIVTDSYGNILIENAVAAVANHNWSYTFRPDMEADINGNELVIRVLDALGNVVIENYTVYKIDKVAPNASDYTSSKEWSKTKDIAVTASDAGVGAVEVSFNDTSRYYAMEDQGTLYAQTYTFTGDVYGEFTTYMNYKDALGNLSKRKVTIYNLDNTAPSITDVISQTGIHSSSVTIIANDRNAMLNKSGSGVCQYGYGLMNDPGKAVWQESNEITITTPGIYYVWVRDQAGNISISKSLDVKIKYALTIITNGGIWSEAFSNDITLNNGEIIILPELTKNGYTLECWMVSGEGSSISKDALTMGNADAVLFAVWDKYPEIEGGNRYFTLEQANSGAITQEELLRKIKAWDAEDGILENGTQVVVRGYDASIFLDAANDNEVEVIYEATDSLGNTITKTITVSIVDTSMKNSMKKSYVRFISSRFFIDDMGELIPASQGGLEASSIWRTNSEYRAMLYKTLFEKKINTETWVFTQKDIAEIKELPPDTMLPGVIDDQMDYTLLFSRAAHFSMWNGLPCIISTFKRFSSVNPTKILWLASAR